MALVAALSLLVVAVLGVRLQDVSGPTRVDDAAATHIPDPPPRGHHRVEPGYNSLVGLGSAGPIAVGLVALALWAIRRRDPAALVVAIGGPLTAMFLTEAVLKPLVERTTPKGALSYPSGHVTAAVAVATSALLLAYRFVGPRVALAWLPIAALASAGVSVGVVAVGWHYATDATGGVGVGVGVVCLYALACEVLGATRAARAGPAGAVAR
jgi:undecaprenyl-diphosphatase